MGLIRAAAGAVSGTLADSWLEYITAGDMGANTVLTRGVQIKRGKHTAATPRERRTSFPTAPALR